MSLQHSLRRLFGRSLKSNLNRGKHQGRHWARFERLEGRALLTGVSGDFNGDGFDDLAVGSPFDDLGAKMDAGSVQVIYGFTEGLVSDNNRRFTLDSTGMQGSAVGGEHFGKALTVGDFNGDGYDDLAIGTPDEVVDGVGAGAVHILYGSRFGLRTQDNQRLSENTSGINGVAEAGDKFGSALAAGDFNHDGRDDLAIGSPGKAVGGLNGAGAVNIIYGRKSGLTAHGDQQWTQNTSGVLGTLDTDNQFGFSLAVGDFNGDARDDLAIGIIGADVNGTLDAGAVYIMYGTRPSGLSTSHSQYRHLGQDNVLGKLTADGEFGYALAAGDFNDDSRDDLAVGSPGEDVTASATAITAGSVHVFLGGKNGTKITDNQNWNENNNMGINNVATNGDRFGESLSVGQINRNRTDDLVIGVPLKAVPATNGTAGAGIIHVLFGSTTGLTATGTVTFSQSSTDVPGDVQANDRFGSALTMGDFNGDGLMDVAVGVPNDQVSGGIVAGGVNVFYATSSTLGTTSAQLWLPGQDGLLNTADDGDQFGGALA